MEFMNGVLADTGSDLNLTLIEEEIPIYELEDVYVRERLFHWGWLSSRNRDKKEDNSNSKRNYINEIECAVAQDSINKVLKQINIPASMLIEHYKTVQCKSNYIL